MATKNIIIIKRIVEKLFSFCKNNPLKGIELLSRSISVAAVHKMLQGYKSSEN